LAACSSVAASAASFWVWAAGGGTVSSGASGQWDWLWLGDEEVVHDETENEANGETRFSGGSPCALVQPMEPEAPSVDPEAVVVRDQPDAAGGTRP